MVYSPDCTTKHQSINMGIIAASKLHYRRRFLNDRVSNMSMADTLQAQAKERKMTVSTAGLAEGYAAHVLDATELLQAS